MSVTGGPGRASSSVLVPVTILTPAGPQMYLMPLDSVFRQSQKQQAFHTHTQAPATHSQSHPFNPHTQSANTHTQTISPSFQNGNIHIQAFNPSTPNVDSYIQAENAHSETTDTRTLQRLDAQETQTHTQLLNPHTQAVEGSLPQDKAQVNVQYRLQKLRAGWASYEIWGEI